MTLGTKRRGSYLTRGEVLVAIGANEEDLIEVIGAPDPPTECRTPAMRSCCGDKLELAREPAEVEYVERACEQRRLAADSREAAADRLWGTQLAGRERDEGMEIALNEEIGRDRRLAAR
jgi:hypothetical protein